MLISSSLHYKRTVVIHKCYSHSGRSSDCDWWNGWIYDGHSKVVSALCCTIIGGVHPGSYTATRWSSRRKYHSEWRRFSVVLCSCEITKMLLQRMYQFPWKGSSIVLKTTNWLHKDSLVECQHLTRYGFIIAFAAKNHNIFFTQLKKHASEKCTCGRLYTEEARLL